MKTLLVRIDVEVWKRLQKKAIGLKTRIPNRPDTVNKVLRMVLNLPATNGQPWRKK